MVQRLQYPTDENPDPRGDLDRWLETDLWTTPGEVKKFVTEPDAPTWWHGDEEASQSFFKSMGINPEKWGQQ